MKQNLKEKNNSNKELHLHKHLTINILSSQPKPKQIKPFKRHHQITCVQCGNSKQMNKVTSFCSNSCYRNYQAFKRERYLIHQKLLNQDKERLNKSWWEF